MRNGREKDEKSSSNDGAANRGKRWIYQLKHFSFVGVRYLNIHNSFHLPDGAESISKTIKMIQKEPKKCL